MKILYTMNFEFLTIFFLSINQVKSFKIPVFPFHLNSWHQGRSREVSNYYNSDIFMDNDDEFLKNIRSEFDNYLENLQNEQKLQKENYFAKPANQSDINISVLDFPYEPPLPLATRNARLAQYINMIEEFNKKSNFDTSKNKESENFQVTFEPDFNFTNVGGYQSIKKELLQVSEILGNREKYASYNIRMPKGVILEGPPGNGKTIIAKALSGELSIPFIACSGSEFQEKYVGVGASRIRELFKLAAECKPCIIFIDEIDAIARKRGGSGVESNNGDSERDNTLNELLTKLDGFKNTDEIFLICATNRIDLLDPAFLRPGRIDKKIYIGHPDPETRESIINIHIKGKPCETKLSIPQLVEMTNGKSGAEIENILNEAMLLVLRENRKIIKTDDINKIIHREIGGYQTTQSKFSHKTIERIAAHELGHAVSGLLLTSHSKLTSVHINLWSPRNPGYTIFEVDEMDANIFTKEKLMSHLIVLLSGRITEDILFDGSITTGASRDFEEAHKLAQRMVIEFGMGRQQIIPYLSDKSKEIIDEEVQYILETALQRSRQIIFQSKSLIQELIPLLIHEKVLSRDFIELKIYRKYKDLMNISI